MKKIVISFLFFYIVANVSAQNLTDNFRFGFQASPVFSWMTSDNKKTVGDGANLGFKMGMVAEHFLGTQERYAIVSGIGLAFNQGGALKYNELGGSGNLFPDSELSVPSLDSLANGTSVRYHLRMIEIPVGLKMKTDPIAMGGYMSFFAEVPIFTLGINARTRADIGNAADENVKKDMGLINFSWGLGGGVEYSVGESTTLVGGLFYQGGMLDLTEDNNADKSKNSIGSLTFRLGVLF
jgi:opacity protein-like surface antigen